MLNLDSLASRAYVNTSYILVGYYKERMIDLIVANLYVTFIIFDS